jgi:hypothetical protein
MVNKVSLQSRIERCLRMAEEADELARKSSTDKRRELQDIATQWRAMAAELESMRRESN